MNNCYEKRKNYCMTRMFYQVNRELLDVKRKRSVEMQAGDDFTAALEKEREKLLLQIRVERAKTRKLEVNYKNLIQLVNSERQRFQLVKTVSSLPFACTSIFVLWCARTMFILWCARTMFILWCARAMFILWCARTMFILWCARTMFILWCARTMFILWCARTMFILWCARTMFIRVYGVTCTIT